MVKKVLIVFVLMFVLVACKNEGGGANEPVPRGYGRGSEESSGTWREGPGESIDPSTYAGYEIEGRLHYQPQAPIPKEEIDFSELDYEDFEIYVQYALKHYDSIEDVYGWLVSPEDASNHTIDLDLSPEDREEIWKIICQVDFQEYEEDYDEISMIPPAGFDLVVFYQGRVFRVGVSDLTAHIDNEKIMDLEEDIIKIFEILEKYPGADSIGDYPYPLE